MKQIRVTGRTRARALALLIALLGLASMSSLGQAPILEFSFESTPLTIVLDEETTGWLRVTNSSVHEADGIEIALLSGSATMSPVEPVAVLDPFSDTLLEIPILLKPDVTEGNAELVFELVYTYCIGELCFQIVEELALSINVTAAIADPSVTPVPDPIQPETFNTRSGWTLALPIVLVLLLVAALIVGRVESRRWWVRVLLVLAMAGGLGYGMLLEQDQQAQSIGAVLCTSCVGIEETPHEDPELSDEARTRIEAITGEIDLLLFSATWCHACPYAKTVVRQTVELNPDISYQVIDVDEDRDAANLYGIMQSGRTIVPAILRVDTGEVLLGIENLEERLLALLEASP